MHPASVQNPSTRFRVKRSLNRRDFVKSVLAGAAGLNLCGAAPTASKEGFSFLLMGDLHYDKLTHHDLPSLLKDKPDDHRQVHEYSRITEEIIPRLFATARGAVCDSDAAGERIHFALQVGDLVEGLCGSEARARQQDREALDFVRGAKLEVPFLFTKGNHDVTGPGAADAFKGVFHPYLSEQASRLDSRAELAGSCFAVEHRDALFCFFDAYNKESLPWLEAALAKRTAQHCFVLVHPPAVPYGARSTWHVFSNEREKAQRERWLELLGKNNAFVLSGHIHKYNLLVRSTPKRGKFLQLGVSSVLATPEPQARDMLLGVERYNGDQVMVEPRFSPGTEPQRRAIYEVERPFVRQFQYADLPGYAVVSVNGPQVTAKIYSGVTRQLWRALKLTEMLES